MKKGIIELLKDFTKHKNIFLAPRGNKAIFTALKIAQGLKKNLIIPDQGGWITYSQYGKKLKFSIKELKTDYGIIDLNELKKINGNSVLLYSNPAAYYAEQPVKEIYELCKKNNIFVILDASGSIGSDFYDGNHADMIIASFGKWKPINLGYGGFISIKDKKICESNRNLLESLEFNENSYFSLHEKLKNIKERYKLFEKNANKIKNELSDFNILHKNKRGINVIIGFSDKGEKDKIMGYCEKNKYQFVVCPKEIKVKENAISIEVKRIE